MVPEGLGKVDDIVVLLPKGLGRVNDTGVLLPEDWGRVNDTVVLLPEGWGKVNDTSILPPDPSRRGKDYDPLVEGGDREGVGGEFCQKRLRFCISYIIPTISYRKTAISYNGGKKLVVELFLYILLYFFCNLKKIFKIQ